MEKVLFGQISNGERVHAYIIKNENLEVTLLDYGAIVQSLKYKGVDVVLGYDSACEYENSTAYFGAVIGRVANRIKDGKFAVGKQSFNLLKNEANNTLHGGKFGFDKFIWKAEKITDTEVTFKRLSPDKEEGFPGNLLTSVRYYLDGDKLSIEYLAVSDKDTPINLTNHTYFNFNEGESVENMFLSVKADYFTPIDKEFIPTGEIRPVKGTPMDFNLAKFIGRDISQEDEQLKLAGGYDHNYVLKGEGLREVAVLSSARKNILMRCFTDRPALQLYTGNFLDDEKGKGGATYSKRHGVCLETQDFPNAVNQKEFPSCILKKGEVFHSVTAFAFEDFIV